MDYEAYKFWFDVVQTVALFGIGLHQFLVNRQRVTARALERLRKHIDDSITKVEGDMAVHDQRIDNRVGEMEGGLQRIEGEIKHAPNHDDLKRIHARLDDVGAHVANIDGGVEAMKGTLDVIHQYLLHGGKR